MPRTDPYTSRLEASMRLLTERLAWLDGQTRQLAAENEALRHELDLSLRRIEVEARERAKEIVAAAGDREARDLDAQRRALARRAGDLEERARTRLDEIRARSEHLGASGGEIDPSSPTPSAEAGAGLPAPAAAWPPPEGEPVATGPVPGDDPGAGGRERAELGARRDALEAEVEALLRLRETVVASIRETLIGLAERLAEAERDQAGGPAQPDRR